MICQYIRRVAEQSGTIGMPKGVMLTHDAVIYNVRMVSKILAGRKCCGQNEVLISYLPLNHIAAQIFDVFLGLGIGACIYIPGSDVMRAGLPAILLATKPTFFFGVPRIFEKVAEQILESTSSFAPARNSSTWYQKFMVDYHLQKNT